jgi:AcrR family transcriptional regulator
MRNPGQPSPAELEQPPGQERRGDTETRGRILEAAIACFTQFGNDKTTLNDVARVAGLSRQTIYRYFPDRAALLEEVDAYEARQLFEDVERMGADAPTLEVFLARLIENRVTLHNRYRVRQHLLEHDLGLFNSMMLSRERQANRIRELVIPRLARARDRRELRPDIDVSEAAEWIAINLASLSMLVRATSFDMDEPAAVGRFFARHLCHGLVSEQTKGDRHRGPGSHR